MFAISLKALQRIENTPLRITVALFAVEHGRQVAFRIAAFCRKALSRNTRDVHPAYHVSDPHVHQA
jgi:hypothetical protein